MSDQTFTIDQDLKEAQAMSRALIPYVYDDTLYLNVGSGMPSMTLGALLLRLRRLGALRDQMTSVQQAQFDPIAAEHESVARDWRVNYQAKIVREGLSRLKAIEPYFEECRENPKLANSAYMPEASRRTIVEEIALVLADWGADNTEFKRQRQKTDASLRRYVQHGDFIWAQVLQPIYPVDIFWWLYGKPNLV